MFLSQQPAGSNLVMLHFNWIVLVQLTEKIIAPLTSKAQYLQKTAGQLILEQRLERLPTRKYS